MEKKGVGGLSPATLYLGYSVKLYVSVEFLRYPTASAS